jgi:hypothetical protein
LSKGIVEMFCAANEYDPSRLQGGAESIGAEGLFREVETLHGTCPIQCALVLSVDNAARNNAAFLVGQEESRPRIGEVRLPLVENPARSAQNGSVRVDLTENSWFGLRIDVRRNRATPALLYFAGDEGRRYGSPKQALRDQLFAGGPHDVVVT